MSSSSSDSDSDDFEPIRKIRINIRPKEDVLVKDKAADVSLIKASVDAWRPLGPPPHPSLSRRQSSLSSVSSISYGVFNSSANNNAGNGSNYDGTLSRCSSGGGVLLSSPSCSSLVSEFNNKSSFSNFMSTTSRTTSPLTLINQGDVVPIAIAIQESIELIVRGQNGPILSDPKFDTRFLGNIKVAFPRAFAKGIYGKPSVALKLRMHSTDNIIRYYGSRLIKDLDVEVNTLSGGKFTSSNEDHLNTSSNGDIEELSMDSFETQHSSSKSSSQSNSKIVEFEMDALIRQLRHLYEQSPTAKYYNVDVLRYRIAPITTIHECPLQVCAYWKIEARLIKLRIDFKHSSKSGLNLERLREITFTVNLANLIPAGTELGSLSPDSLSALERNNNNNNSGAMNMNNFQQPQQVVSNHSSSIIDRPPLLSLIDETSENGGHTTNNRIRIPPPPTLLMRDSSIQASNNNSNQQYNAFEEHVLKSYNNLSKTSNNESLVAGSKATNDQIGTSIIDHHEKSVSSTNSGATITPYITYEPQAHWNNSIKVITWKFDTLLSYHKSNGLGSLFAKIDFRTNHGLPNAFFEQSKPPPVNVKFLVTDSTLSKISMSIDSIGYKMSLLKKEIRSGRYQSEPYIM